MREWNPSLWRTCRMLTGRIRLALFRLLCESPGLNVSQLAHAANIGKSDASQELRRIQSRGLLQANRIGPFVYYRLVADPQAPSAAPLLNALRLSMCRPPPQPEEDIRRIARGLSCPRRVALARFLARQSSSLPDLESALGFPHSRLWAHLSLLQKAGFLRTTSSRLAFQPPPLPLGRALARLIHSPHPPLAHTRHILGFVKTV